MIWLAIGLLALIVAALLLRPLWRGAPTTAGSAPEIAFYRDQLAEIEQEATLGYLTPQQAQSARLEVQRRLLAVDAPASSAGPVDTGRRSGWGRGRLALAVPLLAVVLAGSLAIYLEIGAPDAVQVAERPRASPAEHQEIVRLIDQLQSKLRDQPTDVDGWLLLARSLRAIERLPESTEAYQRALALSGGRPDIASSYGEALVEIAQGAVTPAALEQFQQALARAPDDPRARFYTGLAKAQGGDLRGAIDDWAALARAAPPDAPYLPALRAQIARAAAAAGQAPPALETPPAAGARGPSSQDMAAAATMSPEDRQRMIRGMVDGLAARLKSKPDDIDGWLRLGRAYTVLGEATSARDALAQAAERAPQRVDVLTAYAHALLPPDKGDTAPPAAEFIALMRRILELEPTNAEALWFVANAEVQSGDRPRAAELFRRLLDRLPPDAPMRGQVARQLDAAGGG